MIRFAKKGFFTNPGTAIHIIYRPVVDKSGVIDLVADSKENTDEIIQSHAASCDISIILNRCSHGDFSGLNVAKGLYGDFTDMPKTYAEFLQLQIDSNRMFSKLSPDQRAKFEHDPNQFFAQAGTDEWFNKIGMVKEKEDVKEKGETGTDQA